MRGSSESASASCLHNLQIPSCVSSNGNDIKSPSSKVDLLEKIKLNSGQSDYLDACMVLTF